MRVEKLLGAEINGVSRRVRRATTERAAPDDRGRPTGSPSSRGTASAGGRRRRPASRSTRPASDSASPSTGRELLVGGDGHRRVRGAHPRRGPDRCGAADAVLLGAVGGPEVGRAERRRSGRSRRSSRCAGGLGLFANLRPVAVEPALVDSSPLRPELLEGVDMLIVRELTGGLYFGDAAARRRRRAGRPRDGLRHAAVHRAGDRAAIVAARVRAGRGPAQRVTSVDKANVLATRRLWRTVADEVAVEYPGRRR